MTRIRRVCALLGFGGAFVFAFGLAVSYARPTAIESLGAKLIRIQVERDVRAAVQSPAGAALVRLGSAALRRKQREAEALGRTAAGLRARIDQVSREMRDPACECRLASAAAVVLESRAGRLKSVEERLTGLIRSRYQGVAAALMREFRIFCTANGLVLLLLGLAAVARPRAGVHLMLPAAILVGAAIVVGSLYLFQQNWLHTIVFGEYVGLYYFGYLAAAALGLGDVLLNRGRLTTWMINGVANGVGAAVSVSPC